MPRKYIPDIYAYIFTLFFTLILRNNNRNEPDVQSMQQENINLKLKLKNLETQLTAFKVKFDRTGI